MAADELGDKIPDMAGPIEYKDAPVRFTFVLDGRKEPVKIVEPHIDLPFPDGGRLLVDEDNMRICDVVFRFKPDADNPYCLHFKALDEERFEDSRLFAYGSGKGRENDLQAVYKKTILERGNVRARIEMTGGKARLLIHYRKGYRIPPDQP
jgi:hypothetical protein